MPKLPIVPPSYPASAEQVHALQDVIKDALANQSITHAEVTSLLNNLQDMAESDQRHIVRGMELTADQIIPGLGLLHYFSRIVEQKYPAIAATYTISQSGRHLKMSIEATEQDIVRLEETLEKYSLILLGKLPLNQLLSEEKALMELKQTLDLSALIVNINETLKHNLDDFTGKAPDLEEKVRKLHTTIGHGISGIQELQLVISSLLKQERDSIRHSLQILRSRLSVNMSQSDEAAVKEALLTVKEQEPDAFNEIREVINRSSQSGAAGDVIYSWIASLSRIMPN